LTFALDPISNPTQCQNGFQKRMAPRFPGIVESQLIESMKKIILSLAVIVALVVVVGLAVLFFSLNSIVKKGVETVGPQVTKVSVTLGEAKISPFSGSGELSKFVVGNPEGYKSPSAMQFDDVKLAVSIGSLMSDTIVVNDVSVQGAQITLEGNLMENNLSKILDNVKGTNATPTEPKPKNAPATSEGSKSSKKFVVKHLLIAGTKASLDVTLPQLGHKTMSVTVPTIELHDIGTADNGVTVEQLVQTVMKPLIEQATKAASEAALGDIKGLDKDSLNKAAKSVTDLFKK
jgi:hypothetical protein